MGESTGTVKHQYFLRPYISLGFWAYREYLNGWLGAPYGTRTRVSAVKGRRPGPLDEGDTKPAIKRRPRAGRRAPA